MDEELDVSHGEVTPSSADFTVFVAAAGHRLGCMEEAQALVNMCATEGISARRLDLAKLSDLEHLYRARQNVKRSPTTAKRPLFVLWNISAFAVPFTIVARIFRIPVLHLSHEPGGVRAKVKKGDSIIYSVAAALLEFLVGLFACKIGTPNNNNAKNYQMSYLPLLYLPTKTSVAEATSMPYALHVGRIDTRRCSDLLQELKLQEAEYGIRVRFFPADFPSSSEADKLLAYAGATCVVNCYRSHYNQSGVTGDSLRSGTPLIVSTFEPIADAIQQSKAGIVIPADLLTATRIADEIKIILKDPGSFRRNSRAVYMNNFGLIAFKKHWLPVLHLINGDVNG